jgi:hypothetical protein
MSGPNPPGTGDVAIGDLDLAPWLLAAAPGGSCGYVFEGFFSPVNNPPDVNVAKAGRAVPVKWRIVDEDGTPVDDPASFVSLRSHEVECGTLAGQNDDQIENYVPGSGLTYKGDGNWQFTWDTRTSYAGSCRVMVLTLADGTAHTANFEFR